MDWSDAVAVGDIDCTPHTWADDYDCCLATNGRWSCTREGDHVGRHFAGDGDEICAVWA